MPRYVALLRGINVGGRRKVAMADLRAMLEAMGYADVLTYLASGNAVISAPEQPADKLARAIEARTASELGTEIPVLIRTGGQLADVLARNPLRAEPAQPSRYFVAFLSAPVDAARTPAIQARATGEDRVWISGTEVFLSCPRGFSVLDLISLIEKEFSVTATQRTWNTVTKLASLTSG